MGTRQAPKPSPTLKAEDIDLRRINQGVLAKILNTTVQTIRGWEMNNFSDEIGPFPAGKKEIGGQQKLYNLHVVLEWFVRYSAYTRFSKAMLSANKDNITLEQAKTQKEIINVELAKIELERELGNLLPRAEVRKEWSNVFSLIKGKLLNLAVRLASLPLEGLSIPEKADLMDTDIRELLTELATLDAETDE